MLVALILAFQPVSASFNPLVTVAERVLGRVTTRDAAVLVAAQVVGGLVGVVVANLMFDLDAVTVSTHERGGSGQLLGEVVATFGLLLVVFGSLRSARVETVAFAVGGYIAAAYWFTSSTSFANPAVTLARTLSDTFAGIDPSSVPRVRPHADRRCGPGARPDRAPPPTRPGGDMSKPTVLFVCVHNAGRSQMAAGYLQHLAGDRIDVRSAGSQPKDQVNPVAVAGDGRGGHRHHRRGPEGPHRATPSVSPTSW